MNATSIEWTDSTWNPVTGCSKVSPGCKHCYAETIANRFWKGRKFTDVRCHDDRLEAPLHWKKPRRIFVNSMSDLFHEDVPDEFIDKVFAVTQLAYWHTYQILTKRADRMLGYLSKTTGHNNVLVRVLDSARELVSIHGFLPRGYVHPCQFGWPYENTWLGVSVEDQQRADERIPLLLQTPAQVRFLSCEPLLGQLELRRGIYAMPPNGSQMGTTLEGLHLVIVGGESGPGARPCNIAWIRSIVEQCKAAGVACFVKQLGPRPYDGSQLLGGSICWDGMEDKKGADPSEWPEDLRVRQMPDLVAQEQ